MPSNEQNIKDLQQIPDILKNHHRRYIFTVLFFKDEDYNINYGKLVQGKGQ